MKYCVYILKSLKNSSLYVGYSQNVSERLLEHNKGFVSATKYKRPYEIVFQQSFKSESEARRIELKLKNWKRRDFLEKIIADGVIKSD